MITLHHLDNSRSLRILPMMLNLYVSILGGESPALRARIDTELVRHFGFIEASLTGRKFLVGEQLSGADIQLGFLAERLNASSPGASYPSIGAWLARLQVRQLIDGQFNVAVQMSCLSGSALVVRIRSLCSPGAQGARFGRPLPRASYSKL